MPQLTMKQLADLAGLDVSTVSRALRGDRKRVAASTIERVQTLAAETGFVVDPNASNLRSGRTHILGVVVTRLTDPVMGMVVTAIDEAARNLGYLTTVVATHDDPDTRTAAVDTLLSRRADGLILCDSLLGSEIPAQLPGHGIPFVFAMRGCDGEPSFTADDLYGGRLVAEHFINAGHRDLAVVAGPEIARTAVERLIGFNAAVSEHPTATVRVAPSRGYEFVDGYKAVAALLSDGAPPPTALFCTNDYAATGAARAASIAGLRVGSDIAIAGYNDLPQSEYLQTPLTSVRTDIARMGNEAALQLIGMIREQESPTSLVIKPQLVVRQSSNFTVN
ncbi:LacI family transcriptional regulator [Gordonia terrae]|uniref:LacI family transcriptional regulator n=1 Tax=Gordonia terrae TaxID=2055 RepID=A0A2I1R4P4_9ACTN|nr:LacI family DNA-binding transcriptional regulator [Gordonia terrae]PKZ64102.1 LacI family transcriptional regulator [Gordonia terrae]